jgi:hypothetical protein
LNTPSRIHVSNPLSSFIKHNDLRSTAWQIFMLDRHLWKFCICGVFREKISRFGFEYDSRWTCQRMIFDWKIASWIKHHLNRIKVCSGKTKPWCNERLFQRGSFKDYATLGIKLSDPNNTAFSCLYLHIFINSKTS